MLVDAAKGLEPQTRKLFEVRNKTERRLFVSCYVESTKLCRHFCIAIFDQASDPYLRVCLSCTNAPHFQRGLRLSAHDFITLCLVAVLFVRSAS